LIQNENDAETTNPRTANGNRREATRRCTSDNPMTGVTSLTAKASEQRRERLNGSTLYTEWRAPVVRKESHD